MEQYLTIPRLECRSDLLASSGIYCLTNLNQYSTYSTHLSKQLGTVGADRGTVGRGQDVRGIGREREWEGRGRK